MGIFQAPEDPWEQYSLWFREVASGDVEEKLHPGTFKNHHHSLNLPFPIPKADPEIRAMGGGFCWEVN